MLARLSALVVALGPLLALPTLVSGQCTTPGLIQCVSSGQSPDYELCTAGGNWIAMQCGPLTVCQTIQQTIPSSSTGFAYRSAPNYGNGKNVGIVAYWPNWAQYTRPEHNPDVLDLSKVSVVNYAFLNVNKDGTLQSFDAWADFGGSSPNPPFALDPWSGHKGIYNLNYVAREKYPNLRTVISVGGWSGSVHFSDMASSDASIATFVTSIKSFMDQFQFDGVDLDWEYPAGGGLPCNTHRPEDPANFVKLVKALRQALGKDRIISMASSGVVSHYVYNNHNYLKDIVAELSYMQVMVYDLYGSWVPYADFNAPLNNPGPSDPQRPSANYQFGTQLSIASSMTDLVNLGIAKKSIVGGLSFYGRSWAVSAAGSTNGLFQLCKLPNGQTQDPNHPQVCPPITGDALDAIWTDPCGSSSVTGVWMYYNLRKQQVLTAPTTPAAGWSRHYWNFAQSSTLFDGTRFIAYDDTTSIQAKSQYYMSGGFGGVMIWEISEDYQNELLNSITSVW